MERLCSAHMSDGAVRWQLQGQVRLMAQSSRGCGHALRKWLIKHGPRLAEEGRSEVESVLALLSMEEGPMPMPPLFPHYQQLVNATCVEFHNTAGAVPETASAVPETQLDVDRGGTATFRSEIMRALGTESLDLAVRMLPVATPRPGTARGILALLLVGSTPPLAQPSEG
eukprot:1322006-Amphidinium_carterae.1